MDTTRSPANDTSQSSITAPQLSLTDASISGQFLYDLAAQVLDEASGSEEEEMKPRQVIMPRLRRPVTSTAELQVPAVPSPLPTPVTQPIIPLPGPVFTTKPTSFQFGSTPKGKGKGKGKEKDRFWFGQAAPEEAEEEDDTLLAVSLRSLGEQEIQKLVARLKRERDEAIKARDEDIAAKDEATEAKDKAIAARDEEVGRGEVSRRKSETDTTNLNSYIADREDRHKVAREEVEQGEESARQDKIQATKVNAELRQVKSHLSRTEKAMEIVEAEKMSLRTQLGNAQKAEKTIRHEAAILRERIAEAERARESLSAKIAQLEKARDGKASKAETDNKFLADEIECLRESVDQKVELINHLEVENTNLRDDLAEAKEELAIHMAHKSTSEPTKSFSDDDDEGERMQEFEEGETEDEEEGEVGGEKVAYKDAAANTTTSTTTPTTTTTTSATQTTAEAVLSPPHAFPVVILQPPRPTINLTMSRILLILLTLLFLGLFTMARAKRSNWEAANAATRRAW